ncbi:MAG TPA: acylphosphatase [bacterium (Candidatus Stahlbacteria)]|nr:acylphosphatase [Candidatus Stahlbacteria bacterium]
MMRLEAKVKGVVQGVGYRFFAVRKAREYGLVGFVKNLPHGEVLVVAEGEKGLLHDFLNDLRIGPLGSHVSGVEVNWSDKPEGFKDFTVMF